MKAFGRTPEPPTERSIAFPEVPLSAAPALAKQVSEVAASPVTGYLGSTPLTPLRTGPLTDGPTGTQPRLVQHSPTAVEPVAGQRRAIPPSRADALARVSAEAHGAPKEVHPVASAGLTMQPSLNQEGQVGVVVDTSLAKPSVELMD